MYILVLGGTGAMGIPLVQLLSKDNTVYVTSRKPHQSVDAIHYMQGNALEKEFLLKVLALRHWDAIVDFMVYPEAYFKDILPDFLERTAQYVYISSARVYAESSELITEDTPRLLDASKDTVYLKTNEYALAKAREENLLRDSGRKNYTIIRPSITYNVHRLQLGVLEKENWLYRALHGRTIVFSKDVDDKLTTMTFGDDVAKGIASVVGKEQALGEAFHITYPDSLSWHKILEIYLAVLEKHLGRKVPVLLTEKSTNLTFKGKIYQLIYCRYFNRTFDNRKIARFCDVQNFLDPRSGLASCLSQFLKDPKFSSVDWNIEAVNDRATGEHTPLGEIPTLSGKIHYMLYRYNLTWIRTFVHWGSNGLRKVRNI